MSKLLKLFFTQYVYQDSRGKQHSKRYIPDIIVTREVWEAYIVAIDIYLFS